MKANEHSMGCWQLECLLNVNDAITVADALEAFECTVSCFESEQNNTKWVVRVFTESKQILEQVKHEISVKAAELKIDIPTRVEQLENVDWVSETQKRFKPFAVGKFFIHSSYYKNEEIPTGLIAIEVDAKMAFGTGEHETTTGCMQALCDISDSGFMPQKILDMGCGSGILAIAAAKLWPKAQLVAADIEAPSVEVTKENFIINGIKNKAVIVQSDGYMAKEVGEHAPYDLILCNILAAPLIAMAKELKSHLRAEGKAVLSGLLACQQDEVIPAHEKVGLTLSSRYPLGQWMSLVFKG